jgi:3',5'-cyclic AMP phosphodiesterase CpdA
MRRALAAGLAVAVLAAGCGSDPAAGPPPGSTLTTTLVDRDGDGALERGPGKPLRDRSELGGGGRPTATLATFAQITDAHVRDEESPGRVPFLDRLGGVFSPVFRPQEALTTQVLGAAVRSVNRLRPQAVVVTGDLADNAQANELDAARAVLSGGRVHPDSGAAGYASVQEAGNPDPFYYRPDNDPPRHPGLLAAAQRAFDAPGLAAPWFPVLGNHDLLAQGEVPPTPAIEAVATGGRMVESIDPGVRPDAGTDSTAAVAALLAGGLPGRTRAVPADAARHLLSPAQALRRLGRRGRHGGRLDYTFDIGASVRGIVLDVVNRAGGERGVVTPAQLTWLRAELRRAGRRYVVVFSHQPLSKSDGGEAALRALDEAPRVVAAIAGHRHRNLITPRPSGPYWLVETASLADFPQQSRFFRLVATAGGGVALDTWMVDHDGAGLAGVSRELAFLDAQGGRPQAFAGRARDRNGRLRLPPPAGSTVRSG